MPTTRAQVEKLSLRAIRRLAFEYWTHDPTVTRLIIRAVVSEAKVIGSPRARLTMKALLREMYMDIFGDDPVGKREFIAWVRSALSTQPPPPLGFSQVPFNNVSLDDSFDAIAEDITG